jgi:NDP-sugar pyrophosphorylase family protein
MDAIIMCAGLGKRLRPLTDTVPKPLVPVAGRGTLLRILDSLPDAITRIIITTHHLESQIRAAVGDVWNGRPVVYVHQDPLDGTGGALRQARSVIRSARFLVLNGDDLYDANDLGRLVHEPLAVLVRKGTLQKEEDAWRTDPAGRLADLYRAASGEEALTNSGGYVLDHSWFETAPVLSPGKTDEWSLPHAIPELIRGGRSFTPTLATWWRPVGTPEELAAANVELRLT